MPRGLCPGRDRRRVASRSSQNRRRLLARRAAPSLVLPHLASVSDCWKRRRSWCRLFVPMRSRDSVSRRSGRQRSAAESCWSPLRPGTASRHSSRSGAHLDPRPGGWVQLARGDNDPVVLLARVVAALERTGPLRGDLLEELSRRTPTDRRGRAASPGCRPQRARTVLARARRRTPRHGQEEPLDPRVPCRAGASRLPAGAGHPRRSGNAARPPPRRRRSDRDRDTAARPRHRGDASRCRPRRSRALRGGGRGPARANGGVGGRGRAGSTLVPRPRRRSRQRRRSGRHAAPDRGLPPRRGPGTPAGESADVPARHLDPATDDAGPLQRRARHGRRRRFARDRWHARTRSSSRSTIAASGTATTTSSATSSEPSSSVAIPSCSPST